MATAAFAGYEVTEIGQTAQGHVDLADLAAKLGPDVAAVMVTNPVGAVTSFAAVVTVLTPYQAWVLDNGLDLADNGSPAADAAGDGVPNLVKFALGGDPAEPGATPLPSLSTNGSTLVFAFDVKTVALADFNVLAESSTDLSTWTTAVNGSAGVSISAASLDASTQRVSVTFASPPLRFFVRLRVAAKP